MLSEEHKASNCVKSASYKLEKGLPLLKGTKPKFVSLPPIYQTQLGRNEEMFEVMKLLM